MGRTLDFVGERNCEILKGNPAFPVGGGQKPVGPEPELARLLAGHKQGRRRQKGPVRVLILPQQVQKGAALLGLGLVCHGKAGVVTSWTPGATSRLPAPPTMRKR